MGANLIGANLQGANLQGAYLQGADLRGANFFKARNLTVEQLSKVKTLHGTTLLRRNYLGLFKLPK